MTCLFCNIIKSQQPAEIVLEGPSWLIIRDKYPTQKIHLLAIYKQHAENIANTPLYEISEVFRLISIAGEKLNQQYSLLLNNHSKSGQVIPHIHFHILSNYETDPF